jgi:hypothetical protein
VFKDRKELGLPRCWDIGMAEWSDSGIQAQSRLTGENDRGPNQSKVLQGDIREDISSEIIVVSPDFQLQGTQSSGDSKNDRFQFIEQPESPSMSDCVKNYIQSFTSMPIIWWPLSDPRRPLEQGRTRMTWQCVRCLCVRQVKSHGANYLNRLHVQYISQLT